MRFLLYQKVNVRNVQAFFIYIYINKDNKQYYNF